MRYEGARNTALQQINEQNKESSNKLVLLEEYTIDSEFCWVFFYQFEKYLITKNISDIAVGNSPILVSKCDGKIHPTGTAYPIEHYIEQFEKGCRAKK